MVPVTIPDGPEDRGVRNMSDKQNIGIYWGEKALYFTDGLSFFAAVPLSRKNATVSMSSVRPLNAQIRDVFAKYNLRKPLISLSLPTQDIIFRSFVIPWMPPNEIKSVVSFEASKYIPFPLEELNYAYHPVVISRENIKRYRVIFVAIKKETLEEYTNILNLADLELRIVEPAAISLMRVLKQSNLVPEDKTVALVEQAGASGKIIIIHQAIPHFVREFKLITGRPEEETSDPATLYLRLMNEIRISLDYFGRQDSQLSVGSLLLLSSVENGDNIAKNLETDLSMPTRQIFVKDLCKNVPQKEPAFINAIGAALLNRVSLPTVLNLNEGGPQSSEKSWAVKTGSLNVKLIVKTALICVPLVVASLAYVFWSPQKYNAELNAIHQTLGPYTGLAEDSIIQQNEEYRKKLAAYRDIRVKTGFTGYLAVINDLLPRGTWLERLEIFYASPGRLSGRSAGGTEIPEKEQLRMNIAGYAYSDDNREQFRLANDFLRNIKREAVFEKAFKNIEIEKTEARVVDNYPVTFFTIRCD
jgi:hypothetical protein